MSYIYIATNFGAKIHTGSEFSFFSPSIPKLMERLKTIRLVHHRLVMQFIDHPPRDSTCCVNILYLLDLPINFF